MKIALDSHSQREKSIAPDFWLDVLKEITVAAIIEFLKFIIDFCKRHIRKRPPEKIKITYVWGTCTQTKRIVNYSTLLLPKLNVSAYDNIFF
jgi:hypothetical protein